jgi:trimeric autotransporter adhesin
MSTKTSIKRIAAVAAVALTLGGFSAVSANAATPTYDIFHVTVPSNSVNTTYSTTGATIAAAASSAGYVEFTANTDVTVANLTSTSITTTGGSVTYTSAATATWTCNNGGTGAGLQNYAGTVSGSSISSTAITTGSAITGVATAVAYNAKSNAAKIAATNTNCSAATIAFTAGSNAVFRVATTAAGTITLALSANAVDAATGLSSSTALETFTINVSVGTSTVYSALKTGVVSGTADADGVLYGSKTATLNTPVAVVYASQQGSDGAPLAQTKSLAVTAAISGVGSFTDTTGNALSTSYIAVPAATWYNGDTIGAHTIATTADTLPIYGDGRAGTSTVTISVNGVVAKTITVKFYTAKVASISVVQLHSIGKAAGGTVGAVCSGTATAAACAANAGLGNIHSLNINTANNNPDMAVVLKDVDGNVIPVELGGTLSAASSNGAVVLGGFSTYGYDDGLGDYAVGLGYVHATFQTALTATSGQSATLTISYVNTDGTVVAASPVTITIGGAVAKEVISTDASSYAPGTSMIVTITATDKSGNPVYDGAASPALTFSKYVGGAFGASTYTGGKKTNKANTLFAPASAGDFSIVAIGTDAALTPLSATGNVSDDAASGASSLALDAANAATDAANNAYDEAQNATQAASDALAAVTALSAQVGALIASVKSLAAVVAKIKAKVKA